MMIFKICEDSVSVSSCFFRSNLNRLGRSMLLSICNLNLLVVFHVTFPSTSAPTLCRGSVSMDVDAGSKPFPDEYEVRVPQNVIWIAPKIVCPPMNREPKGIRIFWVSVKLCR